MARFSGIGYTLSPVERAAGALGIFLKIVLILGVLAGALCFMPWLAMLAWNYVAPFFWPAAPKITFWVSFACVFLLGLVGRLLTGQRSYYVSR